MSFATRCPQCNTVFLVTGELLTQRSGMVRCGICRNAFNGIEHLIGRIAPSAQKLPEKEHSTQQISVSTKITPASQPTKTEKRPISTPPQNKVSLHPAENIDKSRQTTFDHQLESFNLELDASKEPLIDKSVSAPSKETSEPSSKTEPVLTNIDEVKETSTSSITQVAHPSEKKRTGLAALFWIIIAIILLISSSLAAIYYYRQEIVETFPELEETVNTVCEQLSCPIATTSQKKPSTSTQKQDLNVISESPIRATTTSTLFFQRFVLANTSNSKKPWPDLVLEISDTTGTVLSKRTFSPKDYLTDTLLKTDGIEATTKHNLKINFESAHPTAINSRITIANPTNLDTKL